MLRCLWIVVGSLASLAAASAQNLDSEVTRVALHPDGVWIWRQAQIELPAGITAVQIDNLPTAWDPESLAVTAEGDRPTRVGNISLLSAEENSQIRAELDALTASKEALTRQLTILEREEEVAALQAEMAQSLAANPAALLAHPETLNNSLTLWQALLDGVTASAELAARRAALDAELDTLLAEEIALQAQLPSRSLRVELTAAEAGPVTLQLIYFSPQASWQPRYRLNLTSDPDGPSGRVELLLEAEITQTSGEDWEHAATELYTAFARAPVAVPPLASLNVDRLEFELFSAESTTAHKAPDLLLAEREALALDAEGHETRIAEILSAPQVSAGAAGFATFYRLAAPLTLASGHEQREIVTLLSGQAAAQLAAESVPLLDSRVYLIAKLESPFTQLAPAAPAVLLRDGIMVGSTNLPSLQPGAEIELPFGIDPLIEVRRDRLRDLDGNQNRIVNRRNRTERQIEFQVTSYHDFTMPLALFARLPVAGHEDIRIQPLSAMDPFDRETVDQRPGVGVWDLALAPGETVTRTLAFTLSWPLEMEITPLEPGLFPR